MKLPFFLALGGSLFLLSLVPAVPSRRTSTVRPAAPVENLSSQERPEAAPSRGGPRRVRADSREGSGAESEGLDGTVETRDDGGEDDGGEDDGDELVELTRELELDSESGCLDSRLQLPESGGGLGLPGEFEEQAALLLGCHELPFSAPEVFADIVSAVCGRIPVVALVAEAEESELVRDVLKEHNGPVEGIHIVRLPHDTMWIRDYGPVVVRSPDGSQAVLNGRYDEEDRTDDDCLPSRVAALLGMRRFDVPLNVDGGNLLANGEGLCLCTTAILEPSGNSRESVREGLEVYYGCREIVFLEPLAGEDTGHVDMFATFTSPDTVVLGQYDREVDAENSALLDRNARALKRARAGRGGLRIVRVPMPERLHRQWRTYTNVVYANGTLLVPVYSGDDKHRPRALATFSSLLPAWEIVGIEVDSLAVLGGTLHCVSRNLISLGRLGKLSRACE